MILKKNQATPTDSDIHSLDSAVDELTKQAEVLQGTKPKTEKPTLPKPTIPHRQGHHFDIIPSSQPTKLTGTLKTAPAVNTVTAGSAEPTPVTQVIKAHTAGSLGVTDTEAPDEATKVTVTHTPKVVPAPPVSSKEPVEKEVKKQPEVITDSLEASSLVEAQVESESEEPSATGSNEVYGNNLVGETTPKGYQAEPTLQKPTVFDTNEYHPPLQVTSGSKHPILWFIVLLLAVVVVSAAFFVILSGKLTF